MTSGGILIQNMGDAEKWISIVTLGFAHKFPNRLLLSVDIDTLFEDDDTALEPYVGWEWQMNLRTALRFGMSDGHLTAGVGLALSDIAR